MVSDSATVSHTDDERVSAEETPQEMWNELCNHFLTEAFDHALQPVSRNWPKPPIALLPGLEDMRDDMHEALVNMINERGWPIEFDEEVRTADIIQRLTKKGRNALRLAEENCQRETPSSLDALRAPQGGKGCPWL